MTTATLAETLATIYADPDEADDMASRIRVLVRQRLALATVEAAQTVRCPACATDLPRTAFGALASRPNGLQPYCRPCRSAKARRPAARTSKDIP